MESGEKFNEEIGVVGEERISGGDIEFFYRLAQNGEKMVFAPSVIVDHRIQKKQFSFKYLVKRAIAGGRGWVRIQNPFDGCVCIFGIPRFLYLQIISNLVMTIYCFLIGKNQLEPLMKLFEFLGCTYEYKSMRKKNILSKH